jgi:hypothetical protein
VAFTGEALADGSDSFGRFEFYANGRRREAESGCEALTDGSAEILEFRAFEDDGGIDVGNAITPIGREFLCVKEELNGTSAAPLGSSIGEVHADVAEGEGAKNGVGDGMGEDIGIGMTGETELAGDGYAAEDKRPAGFDAMSIPTLADAERKLHR